MRMWCLVVAALVGAATLCRAVPAALEEVF